MCPLFLVGIQCSHYVFIEIGLLCILGLLQSNLSIIVGVLHDFFLYEFFNCLQLMEFYLDL